MCLLLWPAVLEQKIGKWVIKLSAEVLDSDEIRCMCDSIMGLLPQEDKGRYEMWFKAKMMFNDVFVANTKRVGVK